MNNIRKLVGVLVSIIGLVVLGYVFSTEPQGSGMNLFYMFGPFIVSAMEPIIFGFFLLVVGLVVVFQSANHTARRRY